MRGENYEVSVQLEDYDYDQMFIALADENAGPARPHMAGFNDETIPAEKNGLTYSHMGMYSNGATAATTSDVFNTVAEPRPAAPVLSISERRFETNDI
jgi:hypothetical protein